MSGIVVIVSIVISIVVLREYTSVLVYVVQLHGLLIEHVTLLLLQHVLVHKLHSVSLQYCKSYLLPQKLDVQLLLLWRHSFEFLIDSLVSRLWNIAHRELLVLQSLTDVGNLVLPR